jgi:hypothetical protein
LVAGTGCGAAPESVEDEALGESSSALVAGSATLRNRFQTVLWSGEVGPEDAPTGGEPPECQAAPCERFDLNLKLSPLAFANSNRPGGVQFAVRWFGDPGPRELPPGVPGCCGEFDALNIYVYHNGQRVASSEGIIATSASAFLPEPENGLYQVYVAANPTYNLNPSVRYEALAEVEYKPFIQPVRPLLPDLEFRSARTVTFDTPSFPLFEPDPAPGETCYDSEKEEEGAQICLRFDQVIANTGKAPAELRMAIPLSDEAPAEDDTGDVTQRVYYSDGSSQDQPGGSWEFHGIHDHYHFTSFAVASLWPSDSKGRRMGTGPVRSSNKVSFCIVDIEIDAWAEKGDGPRQYFAPDCLFPTEFDDQFAYIVQGLTNGWSDVYEWYLPDQYIEVSGLPNGYYLLESCADPDNAIEEVSERNNCVANLVRLDDVDTPARRAQNLGEVSGRHHAHFHGGDHH